jgi:predicted RNA binding protein YcfA (HicA-like mRNA interferase family)
VKAISGKDFAKLLERKDWVLRRVNGSHHIYCKEGNPARISLPVHRNVPLKVGLQKHLMKIAGIEESEL